MAWCGLLVVVDALVHPFETWGERVSCRECGFEQDRGRFCGRCGAATGDTSDQDALPDSPQPDRGHPQPVVSETSLRQDRMRRPIMGFGLLLVAVTVTVLVGLGAPSEDDGTAAGEVPGASESNEEAPNVEPGLNRM